MTNHITINSTVPRIRYVSNGVLATYTYPFAIFKSSDLKVYFDSTIQESSTYSVSGAGSSSGGTITLSTVPENGVIITLTRELSIERTSDFQEGSTLRAKVLNDEFDYQTACQQQIAENLNRSMVLPPYASTTDVDLTLPLPSAGKAIVWNENGTNLENSTVSVNALESTLNGYKTIAEAAAETATIKSAEATTQAQTATSQATTATEQATIATQKAQEVSSALHTKANVAMDNLTVTGKSKLVTASMPDYTQSVNVLSSISSSFTAPIRGRLTVNQTAANTWFVIWADAAKTIMIDSCRNDCTLGGTDGVHADLEASQTVYFDYNHTPQNAFIFPYKGDEE